MCLTVVYSISEGEIKNCFFIRLGVSYSSMLVVLWMLLSAEFYCILMAQYKKEVTPLLTHWIYVLLALNHRYVNLAAIHNRIPCKIYSLSLPDYVCLNKFKHQYKNGPAEEMPSSDVWKFIGTVATKLGNRMCVIFLTYVRKFE